MLLQKSTLCKLVPRQKCFDENIFSRRFNATILERRRQSESRIDVTTLYFLKKYYKVFSEKGVTRMIKDWRIATKAYVKAQEKAGRVFFFKTNTSPSPKQGNVARLETVSSLEDFLNSPDGKAGLELLYASEKTISFGEYWIGSGHNRLFHEYFLNGTGLYLSVSGLPYEDSRPYQQVTETRSITSEEAVDMYSKYSNSNITGFMPWLRAELDKIAAAAPQPTES